ncbi:MAG: type II toxin-antitoxin system Phd/YefM family antitoxin [Candidatus Omnitrophica bacterium]|nr:type II toxin-antitoxin system Phd/YefM family antitoxin [Candidatus Omnitrophota bacterium]
MNRVWEIDEAKKNLGQLLELAESEGPQGISREGELCSVVLSPKEYRRLTKAEPSLDEFFQSSGLEELDLKRQRDYPRDVDF